MLSKHIKLHFILFFIINIFLTSRMAMSQEYLEQVIQRLNTIEQELREIQKRTYTNYNGEINVNKDLANNMPSDVKNARDFSISDHESRIISLEDQVRNLNGKIEELDYSIKNLQGLVQESLSSLSNKIEAINSFATDINTKDPNINNSINDIAANNNQTNLIQPNEELNTSNIDTADVIAPLEDVSPIIYQENSQDAGESDIPLSNIDKIETLNMQEPEIEEVNILPDPNASINPTMQTLGTIDNETTNIIAPANPANTYKTAYEMLSRADYESAEIAFKSFIGENPDDPLASNAYYWLGETYYVRKFYKQAARSFAIGFQKFPNGSKAPDQLLKLGMSLVSLGKNEDACATFAKLELEFPDAPSRISNRASQYIKRAECS